MYPVQEACALLATEWAFKGEDDKGNLAKLCRCRRSVEIELLRPHVKARPKKVCDKSWQKDLRLEAGLSPRSPPGIAAMKEVPKRLTVTFVHLGDSKMATLHALVEGLAEALSLDAVRRLTAGVAFLAREYRERQA